MQRDVHFTELPVVVLRCSALPVTQMKGCVALSQPPLVHEHHIPSCFLQDCFCIGPTSPCGTDFSLPLLKHHQQHKNTLFYLQPAFLSPIIGPFPCSLYSTPQGSCLYSRYPTSFLPRSISPLQLDFCTCESSVQNLPTTLANIWAPTACPAPF